MKSFELEYLLEPFEFNETFFTKRMFGGLAVYYEGKMVLLLVEDKKSQSYKEKSFPFLIWNGLLVPTEREFHDSLLNEFKSFKKHPVLGKWLYLSLEEDWFESQSESLINLILKQDERIGIFPKEKKRSSRKSKLQSIRNIINLGPKTEKEIHSVGIETSKQFYEASWEEIFCRIILSYPHRNHLNMLYALIGAFRGEDWRHISEQDKAEAHKWVQYFKNL